jgi:phage terminase large subunit-like protein
MLIGDHEPTAEIYYAATKRDQAKICFDEAARMVKKSPALRRIAEAMKNSIVFEALESSAKALSSDRDSMDGLRAYCAIIDEYHQHKDSIVSDELMSTMAIRRSPLHFTITTAGFNLTYPCRKLQRMCERLLDGKQQDDSLFTIIYSIDEEDDWKDPETWIKANPNYGVSMNAESFEVAFQKAYNSGGRKEVEFKTKRLNKWVESEVVWISKEKWKACKREVDWSAFDSHPVWLGLDLASKADMTALSCVYEYGGEVYIKNYYFLPEDLYSETIEDDPNHIYKSFEDFDRLILTPGNVTDYDYIRKLISGNWTGGDIDPECIAEKNDIEVLGYDKFNASQLVIYLTDDGVSCDPFPNTFGHMNEPTKELERLVLSQNLVHDGDPILEWMLSNVFIRMDHNGNIKPDKQRSQNKIDGVVSLVMALGEYVNDNFEGPETFEIRLL